MNLFFYSIIPQIRGNLQKKVNRLISLNRDRADCDVDVRPEGYLMVIGRVLN